MSQSRPCVHVIRFAILQVDAAADVHALIEHACLASPLAVPIMPAAPPAALGVGGGLEAGDGGEEGGVDAAQGGGAGEEVQPPPPADEEADGAGERVGGGWEGEAVGDAVGGKGVEAEMAEGGEVLIREKLLAGTRALVCQVRDLERYCCMNTLALVKSTRRHDEGAEQAALPVVLSALKSQGFFASAYMAALLPDCARLKTLQDKILAALAPEAPARKRRPNHSPSKTDVLLVWFDEHVRDPYPSPKAKRALASNAGLDVMQVETCAPLPSARAPPARARAPRCTSLPARHRVHESKEAILAILAVLRFSSSRSSSSSSSSSSRCRRCRRRRRRRCRRRRRRCRRPIPPMPPMCRRCR